MRAGGNVINADRHSQMQQSADRVLERAVIWDPIALPKENDQVERRVQ